jgi:hypothetical protein
MRPALHRVRLSGSAKGFRAKPKKGPFGFQGESNVVARCWVRYSPDPVGQCLFLPGRLDRADPLGIVDQQLTVGQHCVVDGMPVTAQRGQWLADAPATRASTAHRHHMRAAAGAVRPSAAPM